MEKPYLKYARPGGRYTYYPLLPMWNKDFTLDDLRNEFIENYDSQEGVDLYIHLPFCQSLCTFCGLNIKITENPNHFENYFEALEKEWDFYTQYHSQIKVRSLFLGGGSPNIVSGHSLDLLLSKILKDTDLENFTGVSEIDPRSYNKDFFNCLTKWNFQKLSLGIQDFSQEVTSNLNRYQPISQLLNNINSMKEHKIQYFNLDFIYGLPFQDHRNFIDDFEKNFPLFSPDSISLYPLAIAPWQKQAQDALGKFHLPDEKEKFTTYVEAKKWLKNKNFEHLGLGHFYRKGHPILESYSRKELRRNIMGFQEAKSPILIGLGVSSISFVGNCYYQNEKIFDKYIHFVHKFYKKTPPIVKKHFVSSQERELDQLIEKILCEGEILMEKIPFNDNLKIEELERDGLFEKTPSLLKVTELGKDFYKTIIQVLMGHNRNS